MKFSGWLILIFSWSLIIGLCIFCFYKLISLHVENIKPPLEIKTEPKKTAK